MLAKLSGMLNKNAKTALAMASNLSLRIYLAECLQGSGVL